MYTMYRFNYRYAMMLESQLGKETINWCRKQFYDKDWDYEVWLGGHYSFYFINEKDRNWFILRWA